jgi:membrane-bound lytic murein transglycosylase
MIAQDTGSAIVGPAEILDGALDGQHLEICWIKDPTDALLIQIQGSARVRLEDGTMLRITYDAHNGYPYVAVGRILIERNIIRRARISTGEAAIGQATSPAGSVIPAGSRCWCLANSILWQPVRECRFRR